MEVLATIPMMVLAPSGSDKYTGTNDGDEGMGYRGGGDDGGISTTVDIGLWAMVDDGEKLLKPK